MENETQSEYSIYIKLLILLMFTNIHPNKTKPCYLFLEMIKLVKSSLYLRYSLPQHLYANPMPELIGLRNQHMQPYTYNPNE